MNLDCGSLCLGRRGREFWVRVDGGASMSVSFSSSHFQCFKISFCPTSSILNEDQKITNTIRCHFYDWHSRNYLNDLNCRLLWLRVSTRRRHFQRCRGGSPRSRKAEQGSFGDQSESSPMVSQLLGAKERGGLQAKSARMISARPCRLSLLAATSIVG